MDDTNTRVGPIPYEGNPMNSSNPMAIPTLTGLDATTQAIAAAVYLTIGVASILRAPRDVRTRVFFFFALANVASFAVPAFLWWKGITNPATLPRSATAVVLAGLGVAALLLFHFTQVFPQRRPWIRTSGMQMPAAYALVPLIVVGLVGYFPQDPANIQPSYMLAFLIFGFPVLVLLAIVLPLTAIVSLVRSYFESQQPDLKRARVPLAMLLVGQIAGGALALVFMPALATFAPNSAALTVVTLLVWTLGLLTPISFALAVWRYDVLGLSPD